MTQKILIALDDSDNALPCVEPAAKSFPTDNTMIVIGRRDISGLKKLFLGGILQKVFTGAKDISLLIAN